MMVNAPQECIQEINNTLQHKTDGFVIDGTFHRFGTKKNYCWAVGQVWEFKKKEYYAVHFGDWRESGKSHEWKSWGDEVTTKHFDKKFDLAIEQMMKKRREEKLLNHKECREKWWPIYEGAHQDPVHPYLKNKSIDDNYMARNFHKNLLVPLFNHNRFVGGQVISTNDKKYTTGLEKIGSFCPVKDVENPDIIYFTEGYATACSIYMATGKLVIACMDCGGLYAVIQSFRDKYKKVPFVICADNDQWTEGNPGIKKAVIVSDNIGNITVIHPSFSNTDSKPTDFNDLHVECGIDEVKKQILEEDSINKIGETSFGKYIEEGFSFIDLRPNGDEKVVRLPIILRNYFYYKTKFINCEQTRQTFAYNDGYYQPICNSMIEEFAQKYYSPQLESTHQAKEFFNLVKRSRNGDIERVRDRSNGSLICFKNGVLDYSTMEFKEHSHKYFFFNQIPYDYDKNAECHWWDELMRNLTLERDYMVDAIEEYLGYILSGMEYHYNKVLIFRGAGANGKSSLINAMKQVIGHQNCSFAQVSGMAGRFVSYDLRHKLANFSEEDPPKKVFNDTSALKLLTGMSSMRVEQKGQAATSITNYAKLVMAYNELPYLTDFSEGMRRRLLIIPFEMDLIRLPHRKIKNLYSKIDDERSGIANRAIAGLCRLLKKDDFTVVPETKDEINEIIKGSDTVREWWAECVKVTNNENDRVSKDELFENYKKMMDRNHKITFIRFGKKVNDIVRDVGKTNNMVQSKVMKIYNQYDNKPKRAVSGIEMETF